MDSAAVLFFGLVATSLLLCIALAVAWRRFGREAHAALWALAYGLSAANWTASLLKIWLLPSGSELTLVSVVCSVGSFALIALGFRRRAGLPLRLDAILAAASVTVLFAGGGVWDAVSSNAHPWLVALFCSAMLIVSTLSLRSQRHNARRETGGPAFWMLAVFAAYTLGLGILALVVKPGSDNTGYEIYRLLFLMGVPTGLFGVGLFAMFLLAADLAEGMRQLASSDPLTGILNRRGFEQAAQPLADECQRRGRPLSVVIADIDRFKTVNDEFGHSVGDAVLQHFATHILSTIRSKDLFGRLGGEEFVLVLPETPGREAVEIMEQVREGMPGVAADLLPHGGITASFGIAVLEGWSGGLRETMKRADKALYCSKMDGRDRITLSSGPDVPNVSLPSESWALETPRKAAG